MEYLDEVNQVDFETRTKIHELCGQYLGIKWKNIDVDQLMMKRINRSKLNKLYFCELPPSDRPNSAPYSTSPSRVVIKFFSDMTQSISDSNDANICYLIAGEKCLGPKILGIFPGGFISQYFGTRNYGKIDDFHDSSIKLLATKLAQLHALELPIHKDDTKQWHKELFSNFMTKEFFNEMINDKLSEEIKDAKMEKISAPSLLKEVKLIEKAIKQVKSPLVMAHQDFNRGNILVQELCGKNIHNDISIYPPIDIKFIDLDYSGYMYRGLDLGKYISEWRADHIPLIAILDQLPSNQDMDVFLSAYRTECGKQFGPEWMDNELNSIEKLRQESCVFALHAHLQDIAFCLYIASEEKDKEKRKEFLKYGDARLDGYFKLKEKFMLEKNIKF